MDFLVLRFDAPFQGFGSVAVDRKRVSDEMPGRSLVTGLLANALGWRHGDFEALQRLQSRLTLAARRDRAGSRVQDFQTVDLGQDFLVRTGWTTTGALSDREGGSASKETYPLEKHYLADAVFTIVVALHDPSYEPTLDQIEAALRRPARPLFLGRKSALPAAPILVGRFAASSAREALERIPRIGERGDSGLLAAWWPAEEGGDDNTTRVVPVHDERDWSKQMHTGRRFLRHGLIDAPTGSHGR